MRDRARGRTPRRTPRPACRSRPPIVHVAPVRRLSDVTRNGAPVAHNDYDPSGNCWSRRKDRDCVVRRSGPRDCIRRGHVRMHIERRAAHAHGRSGTTTFTYDELGSLLAVNLHDGRQIEYDVDSSGRRLTKQQTASSYSGFSMAADCCRLRRWTNRAT